MGPVGRRPVKQHFVCMKAVGVVLETNNFERVQVFEVGAVGLV